MSVKKEAGRRSVSAEVEVPGSPEQVWRAIATGAGVSSWFVPTQIDERAGGSVLSNFGPGMESTSTITRWEPPQRFIADSQDGPNEPLVATEWTVEAQSGGTCVVRVVHTWLAEGDQWDDRFEGHAHGWRAFFRILRLYLAHFAGQPSVAFQLMAFAPAPVNEAWRKFTSSLGVDAAAAPGRALRSAPAAPTLAGHIESVGVPEHPELLVRLDDPAPGLLHAFAMAMGGQVVVPLRVFLYGDTAAAVAERIEPAWQGWLSRLFPPPA
ncbi:MAG TPA: SRPBCC domain-containing protein [Polyangiaceae bacterium]|nr:SRPBCC domain-containing protein [Polyangiaceae bacterium]